MNGPPRTVHDHDPREVVSALQKCIRRGDVENSLYWAAELERSGHGWWLWKRLRVIVTEDVGPAWPEGPAVIEALWRTYSDLRRAAGKQPKRRPWRLVAMHAVYLLATAPKSRIADWASMVMFSDIERREIPDVALDQHTSRGRRMAGGPSTSSRRAPGSYRTRRCPTRRGRRRASSRWQGAAVVDGLTAHRSCLHRHRRALCTLTEHQSLSDPAL